MAAKKKKAPVAKAKTAAKKAAPARKPIESAAVKLLPKLPPISGKLRMAFRAAFTDDQCERWGELTKAQNVIDEARKWVITMERALKDDSDVAYSRRRLTYLCELVVLLEDEVAKTRDAEMAEFRNSRSASLAVAAGVRRDLARRIRAVVGAQQTYLKELADIAPTNDLSAPEMQHSLTATIALATRVRRDDLLETLADDIGLNEARLNSAYSALESLAGSTDLAATAAAFEGDAPSVNLIEGRVLREMRLAQRLFLEAREVRSNVPQLIAAPSLKSIFAKHDVEDPAPTPPSP